MPPAALSGRSRSTAGTGSTPTDANARLQVGQVAAEMFLGRAAGGLLFIASPVLPTGINAALLLLAALAVTRITPAPAPEPDGGPARGGRSSFWRDAAAGLQAIAGSPLLRGMVVLVAAWAATAGAFWGVAAVYALTTLHTGSSGYGLLLAAAAIGAVIGGATARGVIGRLGPGHAATLALEASAASIGALAAMRSLPIAAVLLAVNGFAVSIWNVISVTTRQTAVPAELLGRVNASYRLLSTAAVPASAATAGLIATVSSPQTPLAITAGALALGGLTLLPRLASQLTEAWANQ